MKSDFLEEIRRLIKGRYFTEVQIKSVRDALIRGDHDPLVQAAALGLALSAIIAEETSERQGS